MNLLVGMVLAALAGSLATLLGAWFWYRLAGERRIDAKLAEVEAEFERRVKAGVLAAGEQLLPSLREQVRLGFEDALKGSRAAGIAEGTAKIVTGSTDLVLDSLSNLFGLGRDKK